MIPSSHTSHDTREPTALPLNDNVRAGIALLAQAYAYAQDSGAYLWDFAVEIEKMFETGMSISDLRWLVAKGFAQHGRESSSYGDEHRSFCPGVGLKFESTTCLVLTLKGVDLANGSLRNGFANGAPSTSIDKALIGRCGQPARQKDPAVEEKTADSLAVVTPRWDPVGRELLLGKTVVKRFRVPARNQEIILSVFEEESWPKSIDDPLPVSENVDPHARLHNAINRLNGNQINRLLCFRGNGNGTGVSWKIRSR